VTPLDSGPTGSAGAPDAWAGPGRGTAPSYNGHPIRCRSRLLPTIGRSDRGGTDRGQSPLLQRTPARSTVGAGSCRRSADRAGPGGSEVKASSDNGPGGRLAGVGSDRRSPYDRQPLGGDRVGFSDVRRRPMSESSRHIPESPPTCYAIGIPRRRGTARSPPRPDVFRVASMPVTP
jgi:hypothetical protein